MQYVWRVRARDQSNRDLFKNQGYSQLCTFTYGSVLSQIDTNSIKLTLQGNALTYRLAKYTWDSLSIFLSYKLEYRKQGSPNWFPVNTTTCKSIVNNLEPENTYEARVKGVFSEGDGPWSNVVTITTPAKPVIACGQGGIPPLASNFIPLKTGNIAQVWNIGQFDMLVTQLENPNSPNGKYSGYGVIGIPFLMNMPLIGKFSNITVNEAMEVVEGKVEITTTGQNGAGIINLDTLFTNISNAIDSLIANLNVGQVDSASLADFNTIMTTAIGNDSALSSLQSKLDSINHHLSDISTTAGTGLPNIAEIADVINELNELKKEILLIKTNPDYFGQAILRPDGRTEYTHKDAVCIQNQNDQTIAFILPSGETFFWIDNGTAKGYFLESGYTPHDSYMFYVEDKYNRQTEPISWGIYLSAYDLGGGALTFIDNPVGTIIAMAKGVKKIVTLQFDINKTWDRICNADLTDVSYVTATFAIAYISGPNGKAIVTEAETPALIETMETFITKVRPGKLAWAQVLTFFRDGKLFGNRITSLIASADIPYLTEVSQKAGITLQELQTYTKIEQLQINLANNAYVVLDNAFLKEITFNGQTVYEIIANESKLSTLTALSKRQSQFLTELNTKQFFTSRSVAPQIIQYIPKNSIVKIKTFIKTAGDGTLNGAYTITKLK